MKFFRFLILFMVMGSCIDPFNINTGTNQVYLVVDGMITDQPGPYTVKLSQSLSIEDQLDKTTWVTGATVLIFDDAGNSETLKESGPGNYQTVAIQGVVGRSYHISIKTADGAVYESAPDKMLPVGDFKNVTSEFVKTESEALAYLISSKNGFYVFLDADVLPEQEGLVRWRWAGTFEIFTYPELQVKAVTVRNGSSITTAFVPDPPLCSGLEPEKIFGRLTGKFIRKRDCTCCDCWVTQYNDTPLLSDAKFISGNEIKKYQIAYVEANRRYLYTKYNLRIDQMSVSKPVYDFWNKIKTQKSSAGDLFQTPPGATKGNVNAVGEDKQLPAIGVFAASSIKTHTVILTREDVPYFLPSIDSILFSCTTVYKKNTTITKPSFW